jgi:site-specific DNA recombinase
MAVIDRLYVHAPDRLARNYAYQAVLVEEFARAGTEVVFLNRPIGQSAEDNLLLQLQGMFAEYECTKMLERSRRGKRHLARAGVLSVMSGAPFGYRYVGQKAGDGAPRFDVAENQAEVVRVIFQWVGREHITLSAVCRRLLEAGVPSPTGLARWGRSSVWNLLSNPTYIGQAAFGKQRVLPWQPPLRPAHGRGNLPKHPCRKVNVPLEQQIPISVPPIVDIGLFEAVQEQLAEVEAGFGSTAAVRSICFKGCSSAASADMLSAVPTSGSISRNASSNITTTGAQERMLGGSMGSTGAMPE